MNGKVFKYGLWWNADDVPTLGNIDFAGVHDGYNVYIGTTSDTAYIEQIPKGIPTGSTLRLLPETDSDKIKIYEYLATTETWYDITDISS